MSLRSIAMSRVVDRFLLGVFVLLVVALLSTNTGWVLAVCPDVTVRPNSPCKTTVKVCAQVPGCPGNGEKVYQGDFQCDRPGSGTTCEGSGSFAPCSYECDCYAVGPNNCVMHVSQGCQAHSAETKREVSCGS